MDKGLIIKDLIKKSSFKSVENFAERINLTKGGLYYKIKNNSFTNEEFERFKELLTGKSQNNELENKLLELEKKYFDLLDKYTRLLEVLAERELGKKQPVSKILPLPFGRLADR